MSHPLYFFYTVSINDYYVFTIHSGNTKGLVSASFHDNCVFVDISVVSADPAK